MSDTNTPQSTEPSQPELVFLPAVDLRSGHVLSGESGGRSLVLADARPNTLIQGFVTVETEHGFLVLDDDRDQTFAVVKESTL